MARGHHQRAIPLLSWGRDPGALAPSITAVLFPRRHFSTTIFSSIMLMLIPVSPPNPKPSPRCRRTFRPWGWAALGLGSAMALAGPWGAPLAIAQVAPAPLLAQSLSRPTLSLGSSGPAVVELQAMLALLGFYAGPVDGQFQGPTQMAVMAFQQAAGIGADGVVGPVTWGQLLPAPPGSAGVSAPATTPTATAPARVPTPPAADPLPTLRLGATGVAVTQLQTQLQRLGFYQGAIDGDFGPQTEAAVMRFQQQRGLEADGIVGPATWGALLRS